MADCTIISADSHMIEPPNLWMVTFQDDPIGPLVSTIFGENNFMWASGFPHSDCTWPNSCRIIEGQFAGVPERLRNKIVCENAARIYGIELSG